MRPLFLLVAVLSLNAQLPKPGSGTGGGGGGNASAVGPVGTVQGSDGSIGLQATNLRQDSANGIMNDAAGFGEKYATVTYSATPAWDLSLGNMLGLTLAGNATSTLSNAPATGWKGIFIVCQDSTGGRTLAWPAGFQGFPDVSQIALSTCLAINAYYDGTNMNAAAGAYVFNASGSIWYLSGSSGAGSGKLQPPATVTAGTIWLLPDLGTSDTFAMLAKSQALTNKTYNGLTVTSTTGTLTIASGKTATISNTATFTATDGSTVALGGGGTVVYKIASGTSALGTSAISSGACATVVTTAATGTLTTDVISASFNGDPTAVTGYVPSSSGMLTIISYPTADNVNFKVCNNTASSITPGAITLNWRVAR